MRDALIQRSRAFHLRGRSIDRVLAIDGNGALQHILTLEEAQRCGTTAGKVLFVARHEEALQRALSENGVVFSLGKRGGGGGGEAATAAVAALLATSAAAA